MDPWHQFFNSLFYFIFLILSLPQLFLSFGLIPFLTSSNGGMGYKLIKLAGKACIFCELSLSWIFYMIINIFIAAYRTKMSSLQKDRQDLQSTIDALQEG